MIRIAAAVCIMLGAQLLYAQQAASRDMTASSTHPSNSELPVPNCEHGRISDNDGLMISKMRDKFVLSIEDLSSRLIPIGSEFSATLRLKNVSANPVTIPWGTSLQDAIADESPNNLDDQTATFSFKIETGFESKRTTALEGEAVLYGTESKAGSMLELAPGQWVTVRIRVVARCRWKSKDPSICPALRPAPNARLIAEWSESEYSLTNSDCDIQRGNFAGPRTESHPETVTLTRQ